jgi:tetratricopeptide (TPR) repeat protein
LKNPAEITTMLYAQMTELSPEEREVVGIIDFAVIYGDSYGEKIIPLLEKGVALSKKINYVAGEVICNFNLKFFYILTKGSLDSNHKAPSIRELTDMLELIKGDRLWYTFALNLLSYFHWFRGEYEKGFNLVFEALKSAENDIVFVNKAWNYYALGVFYFDTKDLDNSCEYYKKAIEYFEKENYLYGAARSRSGLASVLIAQQKAKEALPYIEFAIKVFRDYQHDAGLSRALNDMGLVEKSLGNYDRAVEKLEESIGVRRSINHIQGLITSLTELGEIFVFTEKTESALLHLKEALQLSKSIKSAQKEARIHKLLYEIYKKSGETELALSHFEQFYAIMSKLLSDEAANNIKRIQSGFEKEKSEKEAEIERLKNIELKSAYGIIEQKNKDILDSIAYARRIQNSLMPSEKYIEQRLRALKK